MSYIYHSMPNEPSIEEVPPTTGITPSAEEVPPTTGITPQPPETPMAQSSKKKILILILAIAVIIIAYIFYTVNGPAPVVGLQVGTNNLQAYWDSLGCPNSINDSLILSVHIENAGTSVTNFTCKDGPAAQLVTIPPNPVGSKLCNSETVELLDNVIKGRNTTYLTWFHPPLSPTEHFTDALDNYTFNLAACKKWTEGQFAGTYSRVWYIEYKGQTYVPV